MPQPMRGLREDAHAVGQEHRPVPADPAQAGQDGSRPDERAEHGVSDHRAAEVRETADAGRGIGDQAVHVGGRHRGRDGGRAAVRRQRLHGRVPGGAAGPGREVADDLRGQQRGSGHPHRQGLLPSRRAEAAVAELAALGSRRPPPRSPERPDCPVRRWLCAPSDSIATEIIPANSRRVDARAAASPA